MMAMVVCVSKALKRFGSCLTEGRKPSLRSEMEVARAVSSSYQSGDFSVPIPQDFSSGRDLSLRFPLQKRLFLLFDPGPGILH